MRSYDNIEQIQADVEQETLLISYSQHASKNLFNAICVSTSVLYYLGLIFIIISKIFKLFAFPMKFKLCILLYLLIGIVLKIFAEMVRISMDKSFYEFIFKMAKTRTELLKGYSYLNTSEKIDLLFDEILPYTGLEDELKQYKNM